MSGFQIVRSFFENNKAEGSRSTVLAPIAWLLAILFSSLIVLIYVNANSVIVYIITGIIILIVLIFTFAFLFCLFKDRDALRSEKFTIQKMAIEKGVYGDNIVGQLNQIGGDLNLISSGDQENSSTNE